MVRVVKDIGFGDYGMSIYELPLEGMDLSILQYDNPNDDEIVAQQQKRRRIIYKTVGATPVETLVQKIEIPVTQATAPVNIARTSGISLSSILKSE